MSRPTMGSLFTGVGGFDLAFERAGFTTAWQCEIDDHAADVLRHHWPDTTRYVDVARLDRPAPCDVITFGSPCQDLSVAGKRAGLGGERSGLFFEAMRVIREMREATNGRCPTFIVWENVPGALSSNRGLDFAAVLDAVGELGPLDIAWRVLDAQHFGVPQRRRRIFLVADFGGERAGEILFEPEGVCGDSQACGTPGEDVAFALAASVRGTGDGHGNAWHSNYVVAKPLGSPKGGTRQDLDNDTYVIQDVRGVREKRQNGIGIAGGTLMYTLDGTSQHGVYVPDIVPQAMSSKWAKQSSGPAGDEVANMVAPCSRVRRLTPTECERLQGFPDGWTDNGQADSHRYRQLGNAVAVPVAEWIARRMATALDGLSA
ncbi:MAG: DNA cytosine methyltransferase [Patescibacteria group bacterium]|nr:DNA cytosine methyltransferase [Patescibacteria group bacterium]